MKLFNVKRGTCGRLLVDGSPVKTHFATKDMVFTREELWADFCSVSNGNIHPKVTDDMLTFAHSGWYVFAAPGSEGGESKYHLAVYHTNVNVLAEQAEVV